MSSESYAVGTACRRLYAVGTAQDVILLSQQGTVLLHRKGTKKIAAANHSNLSSGAGNGARTRHLRLGKAALYQMSYSRISNFDFTPVCHIS